MSCKVSGCKLNIQNIIFWISIMNELTISQWRNSIYRSYKNKNKTFRNRFYQVAKEVYSKNCRLFWITSPIVGRWLWMTEVSHCYEKLPGLCSQGSSTHIIPLFTLCYCCFWRQSLRNYPRLASNLLSSPGWCWHVDPSAASWVLEWQICPPHQPLPKVL